MTTTTLPAPLRSLGQRTALADLRALLAVMRREVIIFFRYRTWIVALLIWPVIFPTVYIVLARAMAGPQGEQLAQFARLTGTSDYIGYIVVGTTVWMWQNISLWDIGFTLRYEQLRGTLESNWLSPARRFWFLLGSGIAKGFTLMLFLLVSALEFTLFFGVRLNGNPWLVLLVFAASVPAIYGLGMAFASMVLMAKEANAFVFLVRGLVMVFSGVTFPVFILPAWMQRVSAWLAPTYAIRAMRDAALTGASLAELWPDLSALLGWGAVWLVLGYAAFVWTDRRAQRRGTLGHY